MSNTASYKGAPLATRRVWYTGQNINATNASRTALSSGDIAVGSVLIRDPYCWDTKGVQIGDTTTPSVTPEFLGLDYTQPQTNFLHENKVVVVGAGVCNELKYDAAGTRIYPRWVDVVDAAEAVEALVTGTVAVADILCVTNGSFALSTQALRTDTAAHAVADLLAQQVGGCAMALEAHSGGTAHRRAVRFGCGGTTVRVS